MADQTLNIPQLIAILLISFFALRWLFSSSSTSPSASSSSSTSSAARSRTAATAARDRQLHTRAEQVLQMFPQLAVRDVMWDLSRNGGSVQGTVERIVGGRGLDTPPQTYQPAIPTPPPNTSQSTSTVTRKPTAASAHPDLITRYNLSSKLTSSTTSTSESDAQSDATVAQGQTQQQQRAGWSSNKSERSLLLQQRREQMVLEARRKMQERETQKTATGSLDDKGKGPANS